MSMNMRVGLLHLTLSMSMSLSRIMQNEIISLSL
jgi:hypothetical protein